jgi:hypothetical protein
MQANLERLVRKVAGYLRMGRKFVCAALVVVWPVSVMADDSGAAILHHDGGAFLNGNSAPLSTAIFPYDMVQTRGQHQATINLAGSAITVGPETVVQFENDELVLDHGTLLVNTSRGMKVRVGCITMLPAKPEWTQYDVIDIDGKITVAARKSDVNIESRSSIAHAARPSEQIQRVTVREGEQKTREEGCGAGQSSPSQIAAKAATLNSRLAREIGVVGIGVGVCLIVCRTDNPVSPSRP